MPRYKRTADEAQLDVSLVPEVAPENAETLHKLRNMWEFASLMQYIQIFGDTLKIDKNVDIERLEAECLKSEPSEKLAEIGLQLLKYVSSHRGLTPDLFDEYTRRQYLAKAPQRNPFGDEEEPAKFNDLDIFTRIRVLQQLSTWTLGNADRIRGMMPDADHLDWRMEPLGWDKDDRAYFVLDDNRLYRRTDEQPPPPSPKLKPKVKATAKKAKSRGTRVSKRRKIEETDDEEAEEIKAEDVKNEQDADGDTAMTNGEHKGVEDEPAFGFTDKTWECVAVSLEEYNDFLATIFRSRDANEKQLRKQIEEKVLPALEERAEELRQQRIKELRELQVQEKMLTAKRSGRLADKQERERQEREKREAEERHQEELRRAHAEEERMRRDAESYESRRQTREQRVREREAKRILHEEELARLEEQASRAESQDPSQAPADGEGVKRISERQLKTERARHKKELEKIAADEDTWIFDCVGCGVTGENLDDGTHSVACEKCNVWQHSKCHNISPEQADDPNFHFICASCKQKEEDAKKPKIAPLKLGKSKQSSSPDDKKKGASRPTSSKSSNGPPKLPEHIARQLDGVYIPPYNPQQQQHPTPYPPPTNGAYGHMQGQAGYHYPPVGNFAPRPQHFSPPQQPWQGSSPYPPPQRPTSSGYAGSPPPPMANGYGSPPQHQQQHQTMHQNAVAASGGHPTYYQQPYHQPHANGYGPPAHPPYQYYQPQHQPYAQYPPYHPPPNTQRPGSQGQLLNGFQSPVKSAAQPAHVPASQDQRRPSYGQTQHFQPPASSPQTQAPQPGRGLSHSPNANFPPQSSGTQQSTQSPVKSSPQAQAPRLYQPVQYPGQTPTAPQSIRPPFANGAPPIGQKHQTPRTSATTAHVNPSPAGSNANAVAADGMAGPWTIASKSIPQKHDQTPAAAGTSSPAPTFQTPAASQAPYQTSHTNPSPAGSNANAVAADGMSGPWPAASKTIPQKHDQTPAAASPLLSSSTATPHASQQSAGLRPGSRDGLSAQNAIVPPVALSPSQEMQAQATISGPGSVPVKKSPALNSEAATNIVEQGSGLAQASIEVNGHKR